MNSKLWFQLVDSDGQPYESTNTGKISISSSDDVDDFRNAVKAEFEESNCLKDIPSTSLIVYKNKLAFDDGKEEPLKSSSSLDGLGKTEEEALVVLVPPIYPKPILSTGLPAHSNSFMAEKVPLCLIPFYNNIRNACVIDGWLVFAASTSNSSQQELNFLAADNIPSTTLNRLYIRESYQSIAADIHNPAQHFQHQSPVFSNHPTSKYFTKAIITGTPGIGKSLFLFYLLWQLVKMGRRVLFIFDPYTIYYDGQGCVFQFPKDWLPSSIDYSFWNGDLWCLFDAKYKKEEHLIAFPHGCCTFILSTSPRREMTNDFSKPPIPQVFYMPIWTKAEIEIIAPKFPALADWNNRFDILGGIPRHVLEVTGTDATQLLQAACKQCTLKDCIRIIALDSTTTDTDLHCLVHITSASPFTESSVCYASKVALDIIVQNIGEEAKRRLRELLASCERNPLTAALCGYIFESYAMELLERGGTFTCRQLGHGNTKDWPAELIIPKSARIVADRPESNQRTEQLYVPKIKNYTAIDAWIPGIGAFQMTVSKNQDIKSSTRKDLKKLEPETSKLYWLVPPLHYRLFTKKTPQDMDQYAVLIKI